MTTLSMVTPEPAGAICCALAGPHTAKMTVMIPAKRNGDSIRNSSRGGTPHGSKNDPRWACEYQLSSPMHPHSNCWAEMSTLAASELAQKKRFAGWRTTSQLRKEDIQDVPFWFPFLQTSKVLWFG